MKTVCATIFNLLFLTIYCSAQIYSTHNYIPEDGISTRTIYDITQDNTGRMWFSTGLGISRYDGYKFENYNFSKEVYKIPYRRIITDEKGYVWSTPYYTNDSIRVFNYTQWVSLPPPDQTTKFLETVSFDLYYENDNPVICLGTSEGIFIKKNDTWKNYTVNDGLISNEVLNVCAYNKKFYISTKKGLSVFNSGSFDNSLNKIISTKPEFVLKVYFQKIIPNIKNEAARIWILLPDKLGYIENESFHVLTTDFEIPDLSNYFSSSLVIDNKNNVYFGSGYVKYYINIEKGNVVKLFKENGFVSNGCTSIFLDREENLWVSDTRGLSKLNSLAFFNHNSSIGLQEDDVSAVNELIPGKYIFGHNYGITILQNYKYNYISLRTFKNYRQNSSRVLDIQKDKNGNLWLAALNMGIGKIEKSGNIEWIKVPDSTMFYSVIQDDNGNIIAGANDGLYIYKNGTFEKYYENLLPKILIRKLFNLKDGKIWAATLRGIYVLGDEKVKYIKAENNIQANSVFSIFRDNRNRIFAGTLDGLYIIQNDSMIKFNENNFSIDNAIYAIVQDKNNNYWIGTDKNLVFWDGGKTKREYDSKNGLVPGQINRAALFFDSSDRLWIGTDMGVSLYISELDNIKSYIPKVELLGVLENGADYYPFNGEMSFGNKNNNLKFLFRGISFVDENSIEYKIKLEGFDADWVNVKQHQIEDVVYENLKPGNYVFKVKARNNSGEWSNEVASKTITIENPLYLKWWFVIIEIFSVVLILIYSNKLYNKKQYLNKLEKEVEKRTEELNKSKNDLIIVNENLEERVKQRTSELEESEKKFRELVELLPETIFETDLDGKFVFVNDAGLKKFGFTTEDLYNKISVFDIMVPNYREQAKEYRNNILIGNENKESEFKIFKKDGNSLPVYINSVPVIKKGEITGTRGIVIDMTGQKAIEEKLKILTDEQKELLATKDKFFSIIAHDLRNPFTGLYAFTQVLHEEAPNLSKEEILSYSGHLKKSAENIFKLLENLLQWGRLQTGKLEVKAEKINLFEKAENSIALMSNNAIKKEISIKNYIGNDIYVKADSFMLDSIIQNLLMNSIKFTPRKGRIEFFSEKSGNIINVSVSDTGIGMTKEQLEDIFRLDKRNTTLGTENEPGTGLGVILCKEMIEKQGGTLNITSEINKGSTFKFSLPVE